MRKLKVVINDPVSVENIMWGKKVHPHIQNDCVLSLWIDDFPYPAGDGILLYPEEWETMKLILSIGCAQTGILLEIEDLR